MKNTGIVRRIDELGRVVIPKEIRRTLHLNEGDPLEIHVSENSVCFTKYLPAEDFVHRIEYLIEDIEFEDLPRQQGTIEKLQDVITLLRKNELDYD